MVFLSKQRAPQVIVATAGYQKYLLFWPQTIHAHELGAGKAPINIRATDTCRYQEPVSVFSSQLLEDGGGVQHKDTFCSAEALLQDLPWHLCSPLRCFSASASQMRMSMDMAHWGVPPPATGSCLAHAQHLMCFTRSHWKMFIGSLFWF